MWCFNYLENFKNKPTDLIVYLDDSVIVAALPTLETVQTVVDYSHLVNRVAKYELISSLTLPFRSIIMLKCLPRVEKAMISRYDW